jgi:hypothetical protein
MAENTGMPMAFDTKGVPTVYCNQANLSLSYNDVRVYLAEVSPSELISNPTTATFTLKQPLLETKFCLVMSPEFARSLALAIATGVQQYETTFGPLRPEPTQEQIIKSLEKK